MKKENLLSKAEMKKVMGGNIIPPHFEPCTTHSDCSEHAPICTITGTSLGSICCDWASNQAGGFCWKFGQTQN